MFLPEPVSTVKKWNIIDIQNAKNPMNSWGFCDQKTKQLWV